MSPQSPGPAPAGERPGRPKDGSAGTRDSVFALPATTSFRFRAAHRRRADIERHGLWGHLLSHATGCGSGRIDPDVPGPRAGTAPTWAERLCDGARTVQGLPGRRGASGGAVGAAWHRRAWRPDGSLYWVQPWWYRRRMHLTPLTRDECARADGSPGGVARACWDRSRDLALAAPNFHLLPSRSGVSGAGSWRSAAARSSPRPGSPPLFDAIVLHELGHIRNRDIDQTYLAVAIWWAFVVAALLPMAGLLISGKLARRRR